jgi:toxin ParE1/3/4
VRVAWLPGAQRTLAEHLEWIAERDEWAALDAGDAVMSRVARLASHPRLGRPGRVAGTRELVVTGSPYVVVYRLEPGEVVILRVLHGAPRGAPTS